MNANTALATVAARDPAPTIIGQSPARLRCGGKIRAGIKVLTTKAAANKKAREVYDVGVGRGLSFDAIEAEITKACPDLPRPLVPKNVPYFSVRPGDFGMPEIANEILKLYAEDRGDGEKRLYRFPVVFPADQWQTVMPHALQCYTKSGLKYWSEYSGDGRTRHCMTYAAVPTDGHGRRVVRIWGGRKHVQRPENGGLCDPEICPEYQSKACNLSGRFIFFVPGISSIHPLEMATNSFYAMQSVRETLEQIAFMRGGRISGFLDGRQQTFFMTKKLTEVPHIDEKGMPVRVKHFLISLEAAIDPTRLLRMQDDDELRLADGERAAAVLSGGDFEIIDGEANELPRAANAATAEEPEAPQAAAAAAHAATASATAETSTPVPAQAINEDERPVASAAQRSSAASIALAQPARPASGDGLPELHKLVETMGIALPRFEKFAAKKWGAGWSKNPNGIRKAYAEVAAHVNDPSRLADRMTSELDDFA